MKRLRFRTSAKEQVLDITSEVSAAAAGVESGLLTVFVPHTTCALAVNENADPDVKRDILAKLARDHDSFPYRHGEGNSPAHVKAVLLGSSVQLILEGGRPALGTWQGIYLCEFDGPREREVWVKAVAG